MKFKFIGAALMFIMFTSFKPASEISWVDFNKGYVQAKKKGKIMLVDVYTDWCGWCKRMDKDAYAKQNVIDALGSDFIAVKFNPEITGVVYEFEGKKYNGEQLAGVISNYQITGYPSTVFIYPKGKKTELVVGYKNADQMVSVLAEIKKKFYGK